MEEITFVPELIVFVTDYDEHPAEPEVGIMVSHVEINEIEIRDSDDNPVNVPGLKDYIMEKYGDDLHEVADIAHKRDMRDAEDAAADCQYQLMQEEGVLRV